MILFQTTVILNKRLRESTNIQLSKKTDLVLEAKAIHRSVKPLPNFSFKIAKNSENKSETEVSKKLIDGVDHVNEN